MEITKSEIVKFLSECLEMELERMNAYTKQASLVSGEPKELLLKVALEEKAHAQIVQRMIKKISKGMLKEPL
ncbi:MAG: ferritin family protein [Candidatus Diapherotrites archaeon]|nr:ferritin family protein [Candidatus Diapherotrites archaeon]